MKLLINGTTLSHNPRGVGIYTKNILQHWPKKSLSTDVLLSPEGQQLIDNPCLGFITTPPLANAMLRVLWLQSLNFRGWIKQYDAVLSTVPELALGLKMPYFLTVHDFIALRFPKNFSRRYLFYYRNILPSILEQAHGIIAISENTREDLMAFHPQLNPEAISVIPNGVDHSVFHQSQSKDASLDVSAELPFFMTVTSFEPHKNIDLILRVFAQIQEQIPHKLVLVGQGSNHDSEKLAKRLAMLGLTNRVVRLNYVSNGELAKLYRETGGFLFPSTYEGFGLPLIEAMACGAPVVCHQTSSMPAVVGDAGLLCKLNDEHDWIKHLLWLAQNPTNSEKKEKLRKQADKFQWHRSTREILSFITARLTH